MNLRKLPPSMLLTLGLACNAGKGSDDTTAADSGPTTTSGSETMGTSTLGPCLDIDPATSSDGTGTSGADSTFGPCLSPEPPTGTGTDTGTGTGTGTDSGTDTDTDTDGTTGIMLDEPSSRAAVLERVLERGTLPADVAARLRGTTR